MRLNVVSSFYRKRDFENSSKPYDAENDGKQNATLTF